LRSRPWRSWSRPWRSWWRAWRSCLCPLSSLALTVAILVVMVASLARSSSRRGSWKFSALRVHPPRFGIFSMISFAGFSTIGATQRFSKSKAKPGRLVLYLFSENELEGTPKINFCNCSCVQFCRFFHDQQSALQTRLWPAITTKKFATTLHVFQGWRMIRSLKFRSCRSFSTAVNRF